MSIIDHGLSVVGDGAFWIRRGRVPACAQDVDGGVAGVHVDLYVDDVAAEAARVVALGASVVSASRSLVVVRSRGGLLFCLVPQGGSIA